MSLTPDIFFNGESVCTSCNKPMFVNDIGIVYRPTKAKDFVFCVGCATAMTMSIAQDISKLDPDLGLSYYFKFQTSEASAINLRRHANALKGLASKMEDHADSMAYFHHPDEDK